MAIFLYKNHSDVISINAEVTHLLKNNFTDNFIYIVPTRRKVRELNRDFLTHLYAQTGPALNIFTLETFISTLHEIFCKSKKNLNSTTQAVLFNESIKNKANELNYFFPKGISRQIPKGTLDKIINIINYLKEKGLYPAALHTEISSAEEYEKPKLTDILKIYEEYENSILDKFQDTGTIFKELNSTLENQLTQGNYYKINSLFRSRFPNVKSIFVAGFDEFSDPEITVLQYISSVSKLGMVISFDFLSGNDNLFGHLKKNYEKFLSIGYEPKTDKNMKPGDFKDHIIRNLFNDTTAIQKDFKNKITLFKTKNREEEVELIAKLIKKLVHENPETDLSKVCIALYQPQIYTKLFHEIFPRYGIPANITDRFQLDQSPLVVAIISLLNIKLNNFRTRDIMRAFSNPYFSFSDNGIDIGNLHSVSASLKINAGLKFWKTRISRRIDQINEEVNYIDDDFQSALLSEEINSLEKAAGDIKKIEKLLSPFGKNMTPSQFRINLVSALELLNIQSNIINFNPDNFEYVEKDTRAYQKFLNLLEDIISLLQMQDNENQESSLKFFVEQLKAGISHTRFNILQKYGYGVFVTAMEETRGLDFDIMFLVGLVDSEFPPVYQPEIFLSNRRQKEIEEYHLTENRYLFYQCITNFSEKLFLTYPEKDQDSELVRSSFINSLLKIISCTEYLNDLPDNITNPVYCEDEYISRRGYNFASGFESSTSEISNIIIRQVVEDIKFAINTEYQRMREKNEYNGYILQGIDDKREKNLEQYKEKIYSVSQLEKYAACPFRYFIDNVLYIKSIPEQEEGITPLEKGGILHEVLFSFFIERRKNGLPYIHECNSGEFQKAVDDLINLTKNKLDSINVNDVLVFLEKELILGTPERKGIMEIFLEKEKLRHLDVKPVYFEVPFGSRVGNKQYTDPDLFSDHPVKIGDVKIRGKVDRVEIGNDNFTIVDYKTGTSYPKMEEIIEGLKLQIPIYMVAIEKILKEKLNISIEPAAGIHYILSSDVDERIILGNKELKGKSFITNKQRSGFVDNNENLRIIIDRTVEYVNQYVKAISSGVFPITEEHKMEKVCTYCTFDKICRKQKKVLVDKIATNYEK